MTLAQLHYKNTTNYTTLIQVREDSNDYTKRKSKANVSADLKIDFAFKQLSEVKKNKEITVVFLNAILQKTGRSRIKDISFNNG